MDGRMDGQTDGRTDERTTGLRELDSLQHSYNSKLVVCWQFVVDIHFELCNNSSKF